MLSISRPTTGNTQAYTLRAVFSALDYAAGLERLLSYTKVDPVYEMYALVDSDTPTVYREALALLFVIADSGPSTGYKRVNRAAKAWAAATSSKPFASVASHIQSPDEEARKCVDPVERDALAGPNAQKTSQRCVAARSGDVYDLMERQLDGHAIKGLCSAGQFFPEATGHVIEGSASVELYVCGCVN